LAADLTPTPYTFDKFTVTGKVRSTEDFNKAELTGIPVVLGPVKTGTFTNALSMDQSIVSWG